MRPSSSRVRRELAHVAVPWMEEALERSHAEQAPTAAEEDILEYIAFALYKQVCSADTAGASRARLVSSRLQGNVKRALLITDRLLELQPAHPARQGQRALVRGRAARGGRAARRLPPQRSEADKPPARRRPRQQGAHHLRGALSQRGASGTSRRAHARTCEAASSRRPSEREDNVTALLLPPSAIAPSSASRPSRWRFYATIRSPSCSAT